MNTCQQRQIRAIGCGLLLAATMAPPPATAQGPTPEDRAAVAQPATPRGATLTRPDGPTGPGQITGDAQAGFRFARAAASPDQGATAPAPATTTPLLPGDLVTWDEGGGDPTAADPPFRVELGTDQRLSGRLARLDAATVVLEGGPSGAPVVIRRGGAAALAQRPGEALVLRDGWETLDPSRWVTIGEPQLGEQPHLEGARALILPAQGAAVTFSPPEPIGSGRLDLAYHDPGGTVPGHLWFVDLLFRGTQGPESLRVNIDLGEEGLGVQSQGGAALAIQHLPRKAGWHRLSIRFGPDAELVVDGFELARGRGPSGPLAEVRLAHEAKPGAEAPRGQAPMPVVAFDDFRLVRLAEVVGGLEVAPTLDDVRLVAGDQVFGACQTADGDGVRLRIDGRDVALPWTEVAAVRFRRDPVPGLKVAGLLVRVDWQVGSGADPRDLDGVEGALLAATDAALTVATPYAGTLVIPRDRLRRLRVLGRGARVVVDPHAHHLGNNDDPDLDPPLPEGGTLERAVTLDAAPDPTQVVASLVLDVVKVVGEETGDPLFAALVRKGQLRTTVRVNGQVVDYLNRVLTTKNDAPERIRLLIPPGLLRAGVNTIRFEQGGRQEDPQELDDLGILSIALELTPR